MLGACDRGVPKFIPIHSFLWGNSSHEAANIHIAYNSGRMDNYSDEENEARMQRGELYHAFVPSLITKCRRCKAACREFNQTEDASRRLVELRRKKVLIPNHCLVGDLTHCRIIDDKTPLPPPGASEEVEFDLLRDEAHIDGLIKAYYGANIKYTSPPRALTSIQADKGRIGKGVNINNNCTFIDTCLITIGSQTLIGPNYFFFSGTHPLDPFFRNDIEGPELGAPIVIGEDCWFGGGVTVCPGVTICRGVTVGLGSVVTRDVPDFHVVARNPARIVRRMIPTPTEPPSLTANDDGEKRGSKEKRI